MNTSKIRNWLPTAMVTITTLWVPGAAADVAFESPLVITRGGIYTGAWRSAQPEVAAITVATSEPVVIENCRIESAGDAIQSYNTRPDITVRNCIARALNPNVRGRLKGFFLIASNPVSVVVEHNLIEGFMSAVSAVNFPFEDADNFHDQVFTVRYNDIRNIDARVSDGNGGYAGDTTSFVAAGIQPHFLRDARIEIAWNQVINEVFHMGGIGDTISTAESRGKPDQRIHLHNNFLQGSYPADPSAHVNTGACLIQIGDAPDKGDVGYVRVNDNQLVNFDGCGISVSAGHDNEIDHNRVISAATTSTGVLLWSDWRNGLQMYDFYADPQTTLKPTGNPYWHHNTMHDNVVNVVFRDGSVQPTYFGIVEPTVTQTNNGNPFGRPATTADEQAEFVPWQTKQRKAGVLLGPAGSMVDLVEFYNAALDHYFITYVADEITKLDDGTFKGWQRTGLGFRAYGPGREGAAAVCRIYIPPGQGDGHFYGRDAKECDGTMDRNPSFALEARAFFYLITPTLGVCPVGTAPVYRLYSNRPDTNHRYTTDRSIRTTMASKGWLAEGDGSDLVAMCVP